MALLFIALPAHGQESIQRGGNGLPQIPEHFDREADKAPYVKAFAQHFGPLDPDMLRYPDGQKDKAFCEQFLIDLKAMRGITFVEPIVKADRADDPKLQDTLEKYCPYGDEANNRWVYIEDDFAWMSHEQLDETGHIVYAESNLRIYYINILNDKGGDSLITYADSVCAKDKKFGCSDPHYHVLDRDICSRGALIVPHDNKITPNFNVTDPFGFQHTKKKPEAINAIIKYKNKYFVININNTYYLWLHGEVNNEYVKCNFPHPSIIKPLSPSARDR
ncbi:hypothetical protein CWS72_26650 [Telmatospirillum siberiense]|uniref:Uncharacterized protein n=2 Tax=Telmatospirillum siberiense TaxID=382514 RepID=A0A2N3PM21_9PROT|nr:hypothetical protein CWS72_26650 [Telmatospirillum siberiense]